MNQYPERAIYLADDDADDRMLFEEALREVSARARLTLAHDGQELLAMLGEETRVPDVIFLDLNMPRKNGIECLQELKQSPKLKHIPIVIFSTSSQPETVDKVYAGGAHFYVPKPRTYGVLKNVIHKILNIDWGASMPQPSKDNFILQS
ncbi:response regulator [Chryseolinea lacunae]|uniref:Response regulator n=1 Tax=Chryseolinea lacunae TaxID=2801331 RepID=A0ABS1KYA4_9BACT|nr:response regulator [Chryseolinea lacunae]MBL0744278.1 response regulator [Chryseolinea lacunae]